MLNIHFAGTSLRSEVTSVDHPDLTFVLSLIRTTPTFDKSEQVWELVSDIAVSKTTYEPPRGKTNNVVSEQVRHKPACTSTEKS